MAEKIQTREATIVDLDDLARLNELFNQVDTTPEQIAARLTDPRCVEIPIVAEMGSQIVGFTRLRVVPLVLYEGRHAELTEIDVDKAYRRKGVGSELIRFAESLARDKEAGEIILQTGSDNLEALEFYKAVGYEKWSIAMRKTLRPNDKQLQKANQRRIKCI